LLPGPRRYYYQFRKRALDAYYVRRIDRLLALLVARGHLSEEAYTAA
jgi:hypothetical protein